MALKTLDKVKIVSYGNKGNEKAIFINGMQLKTTTGFDIKCEANKMDKVIITLVADVEYEIR